MSQERVSKAFKDISMTFFSSPLNYDLIGLKNETAIARSLRNLVFTLPGERFFNANLGSDVSRSLFGNVDSVYASLIKDEIQRTINNYEPRVSLIEVQVTPNYDDNEFNVRILYIIIGIDPTPQQLSFALQPTR